jgi:GT2 family glycosyltransferase/glycosyltransferase involved in cell wall biosynthesis
VAGLAALAGWPGEALASRESPVTAVDVIVAVDRDAAAARRSLESLLAAPQRTPFEIVVVSDASPDTELVRWLHELSERRRVRLLEQPARQGLAAALNRAVALHRDLDRDVIILRSGCEVANDWLDRLARAAAAARDIATVTPFASAGGVAGYPRAESANALPEDHTVASLDLLFRRANVDEAVEVRPSSGPCLYLRRECLNAVGPFDEGAIDVHLGVVHDFCLRATGAGYRHLLAADVYVWYDAADGAEIGHGPDTPTSAASTALHPRYESERSVALRDPARLYQRRVDLLRLAESPRQLLLFVAHAWGGGIRRHMHDLATLAGVRCEVLFLEPAAGDTVKLTWSKPGEGLVLYYSLPGELVALASLLRALGLSRVHFHHVHGLPRAVLDLPAAVGVPYDCTLHDYYSICPQYHLVTEDGRYCGEPDAAGCTACIRRRPGQWGLDIAAWRQTFRTLLHSANRVFAPSRDVAQRIARYFPDVSVTILPHAEAALAPVARVVRVVTLGTLSPEKGVRVVAACAMDARVRALPLSFRVLGSTTEPLPQWPSAALSLHGQYSDDELPALIAAERPDVIWFPAQVPESYSYTLSVALASGAAIVASDLGAFPERLAGNPRAMLVPWNANAAAWNESLVRAGGAGAAMRPATVRAAVS